MNPTETDFFKDKPNVLKARQIAKDWYSTYYQESNLEHADHVVSILKERLQVNNHPCYNEEYPYICAYLYGIYDDTPYNYEQLMEDFPSANLDTPLINSILWGLTRVAQEEYADYIERIIYDAPIMSRLIKICDLESNLLRWENGVHSKHLKDKYQLAMLLLGPFTNIF